MQNSVGQSVLNISGGGGKNNTLMVAKVLTDASNLGILNQLESLYLYLIPATAVVSLSKALKNNLLH